MLAAKDDHGKSLAFAVCSKPQAPPYVDRIEDHEGNARMGKLFGKDACGIGLSCAALCQDRKCLGGGVDGDGNVSDIHRVIQVLRQ